MEGFRRAKNGREIVTKVIQPGVDVWTSFNPATYGSHIKHAALQDALAGRRRAYSVGFMGRLVAGRRKIKSYPSSASGQKTPDPARSLLFRAGF